MKEEISHIPREVYLGFLGRTIDIHWNYHAILMVAIWVILVPLCVIAIRFGKPKPKPNGITQQVKLTNLVWWWFSAHKYGLYLAIGLSLVGLAIALVVSSGFSGSVHSIIWIGNDYLGMFAKSLQAGLGENMGEDTTSPPTPMTPQPGVVIIST